LENNKSDTALEMGLFYNAAKHTRDKIAIDHSRKICCTPDVQLPFAFAKTQYNVINYDETAVTKMSCLVT